MKKAFSSFAGRRLTSGPRPKPAQPSSRSAARLASPRPSPAPRWPASARLPADAPRRAPDRGRACPPRGGHAPSTLPRVAAGLRPPTPAGAGALAHSLPRCLSSPPEPRATSSASRRATHPPAQFTAAPPPRPAIMRPQLRLALLQVVLTFAPPAELR